MPQRYAGDGLDFRRPVTTSVPLEAEEDSGVIDLTNEPDSPELRRQVPENRGTPRRPRQRPPRFERDILADVVDLDDGEDQDPSSSPEVQFVSSNTRQPPPTTQRSFSSNLWRMLPFPHSMFGNRNRRELPWGAAAHLPRDDIETLFIGDGPGAVDFTINLDREFNWLGLPAIRSPAERERPQSSYKPPSPAPEGFTRNLAEEDIVTCPNCDQELGLGDEQKEQIYAAKSCGHVRVAHCHFGLVSNLFATGLLRGVCLESFRYKSEKGKCKDKAFF